MLAVSVQFSESDADVIAANDYWVDDDPATNPITFDEKVRRTYHFVDSTQLAAHRKSAIDACEGHSGLGPSQARAAGIYLHALEDSFAHRKWIQQAMHPPGYDDPWDDPQQFVFML